MRTIPLFTLAAGMAAALLAGCATDPSDPNIVATTRSRECKVTTVYTTRESMDHEIRRNQPIEDGVKQAEGTAGLGRTQQPGNTPRALRDRPGIGKVEQAMRDC